MGTERGRENLHALDLFPLIELPRSNSHLEFHRVPTETVIIPQSAAGKQRSWGVFHSERWLTAIHGLPPLGCLLMQSHFGDRWVCIATWNVSFALSSHCYVAKSGALIEFRFISEGQPCDIGRTSLTSCILQDLLSCWRLSAGTQRIISGWWRPTEPCLPSALCLLLWTRGAKQSYCLGRWAWGRGALL